MLKTLHINKAWFMLSFGFGLLGFHATVSAKIVAKATKVAKTAAKKKATKKSQKKAKKQASKKKRKLNHWLSLGPVNALLPSFHKEKQGKYTYPHFLKKQHLQISRLWPKKGKKHDWFLGQKLTWNKFAGSFTKPSKKAAVAYLATYLEADRYLELKLKLRSHQRLRVFLDGRVIATKSGCTKRPKGDKGKKVSSGQSSANGPSKKQTNKINTTSNQHDGTLLGKLSKLLSKQTEIIKQQSQTIAQQSKVLRGLKQKTTSKKKKKPGKVSARLKLIPGVHLLVVKLLHAPKCVVSWGFKGELNRTKSAAIPNSLRVSRWPKERHSLTFLLQRTRPVRASLSPDGKEVVVQMFRRTQQGHSRSWMEWRRVKDGKILLSTRPHQGLRGLKWSPNGKFYTFITHQRRSKSATLWIVARATKRIRSLRNHIKHLRGYTWSPDSRYLILNISQKQKPSKMEKAGAKRLRGMNDRWPWYRTHSHLYALTIQSGQMLRLTAGKWSIWGPSIRPDGKKILFVRSHPNYKVRPFYQSAMYELDLKTLKIKKILGNLRRLSNFSYSPDGKKILMTGSAHLFGKIGRSPSLPKGVEPNHYDTQAYIYNLKTGHKRPITKTFTPSFGSAYWHPKDQNIYFTALDRTRKKLYKYNTKTHTISNLPTSVDLAGRFSFAKNRLRATFIGQGIAHPQRVYVTNLNNTKPRMFLAPSQKWFKRLHLATVKDFVTKNAKGKRIEGRVYFPPDFDPKKKYPALVYYYGGTYPTTRSFDGRYPGHLWAAHGYIVYKLQPSGAIGYGQTFAAKHVNEWGTIVADEIIRSTKQFLKAHPFVDKKRVGCLGASYGGFTTMSLITKTSLFGAAISHAGISNIASYWGAGYWGFLYNATSAANRYPWSHPLFYVKQSPLFSAHKITTPLLLLHGTSDTNVPPAESYQMYTALRLLKKKVEIVLFRHSNHWILRYRKRIIWSQTILAWFDRQLKNQPLWWKRLHGTRQH